MSCDRGLIFPQPLPRPRGGSGFTLIEVLLGLGVMTFCLVVVIGLIPIGLETNKESRDETDAMSLVQMIAADYRAAGISTNASPLFGLPALTGLTVGISSNFWVANDAVTLTNRTAAKFTVDYAVNCPATGSAAPYTVGVTVTWTGNSTNGPTQVSTVFAVPQNVSSP